MRIDTDIQSEDVRALMQAVSISQHYKPVDIVVSLAPALLVATAVWYFHPAARGISLLGALLLAAAGAVGAVLGLVLPRIRARRGLPVDRSLLGSQVVELSEKGIEVTSEHSTSLVKWPGIYDVLDGSAYLFIFVGPSRGLVVPKRSFASEQEAADFSSEVLRRAQSARSGA